MEGAGVNEPETGGAKMTVQELIEKLREFPPDAQVFFCGDVGLLNVIAVYSQDGKVVID